MNLVPNPASIPTMAQNPDLGSMGVNTLPSNVAPSSLSVPVADAWAQEARQEPKTVAMCDTQPVTAEGIRTLIGTSRDLRFQQATDSLQSAAEQLRTNPPAILLLDKAFGVQILLDWLADLRMGPSDPCLNTAIVIWGVSVTEAEALRFLQAGARGILRKTADVPMILACLRTVAAGRSWMEDCVFRDAGRSDRYPRSELTSREQQVLELVEQGFKNKDIATELGIRPGTVKIHLKHIFEKTGVRGRYGLALNGLRDRGMTGAPGRAIG
jgi:two-component system, NarL family, nitrate/nitrite response regulator NarL